MKNTIFLRRKNKLILTKETGKVAKTHVATLLKNIEQLGYTLSPEVLEIVGTFSEATLTEFYQSLVADLKKMVGAHVQFNPMYPNFPKQVMEMSEAELYFNAIMHYIGSALGIRILPEYEVEIREELVEKTDLKIITLGKEDEFKLMIKNLIGANTSISETDKEDITSAIQMYADDVETIFPESIPQKENLAFVTEKLLAHTDSGEEVIAQLFKTATDVLRLAVRISDGDVSLATPTKFAKFKRSQRRLILAALENCNSIVEDMLRYKKEWIRLGEIIHPGEYKKRYTKAFIAFDVIRNDKPFETFNSTIEKLFSAGQMEASLKHLVNRPGELARRLDFLIRNMGDHTLVTNEFERVADKVSTPVLLQVTKHFKERETFTEDPQTFYSKVKNVIGSKEKELRVIFPKGNVGKAVALKNNLPLISKEATKSIVSICKTALLKRFSELDNLGNVFIDAELRYYLVPFSQRSASKTLRTLVRGSKVQIPEGDTIRFFLWWKEGEMNGKHTGTVDIDLSSVLYDDDWNYLEHISYTNLKSEKYQAAHSGDITSAPNGACEFIDIDIPSVLKYGGRYVVMNVYSYSRQPFHTLPECFGGWMMRKSPQSGEIFEPKTVVDKLDLTAETRICIPVILDLKERRMVWTDIALKSNPKWQVNVEGNQAGVQVLGRAMTELKKTNLFELFKLHATARGTLVKNIEDADTVFSIDQGTTPFDQELIMNEYLS